MATASPPESRPPLASHSARWLAFNDAVFKLLCRSASWLILGIAALLVVVLVERSLPAMGVYGFGFVTQSDWNPNSKPPVFGSLAFVYGTVMTSAIAMLIALPLGVGTAAYLSEIASGRLKRVASFFIEMLAAIPSVIYGFWGVFVLAPLVSKVFVLLGSENVSGRGIFSAGLVLSVMIVPYIAAIAYDVCQAVPRSQREGALALGSTRWQTIWHVVLPYARPGIVAGGFLALGRALGETMAVTMLIGNRATIENPIFGAGDSIASRLVNQYMEADTRVFRSVLVELALILLVVTLFINSLARYLLARFSRRKPLFPAWLWPSPAKGPNEVAAPIALLGPPPPHELLVPRRGRLSAQAVNTVMTGVLFSCVAFTMAMLVVILSYLLVNGVGALNWEFFTALPVSPTVKSGGGLANAIVGTITVVGWAAAFAVPVGLLAAIYLAEYRPGPLAKTLRFVSEQLGGVPSIVMGLFAAGLFAFFAEFWERRFGERPRFYGWSGIFALAVMMVPIVLRAAEEALKLVPVSLRSASYALGASHAQTVLRVTVPAALPAIITAVFLSIARIAGETAPLLLTAGFNNFWPESLGDFTPTLPPYIYKYATGPSENWNRQAWAAAFLLMVMVLVLNFGIRLVTGRRVVQASRAD